MKIIRIYKKLNWSNGTIKEKHNEKKETNKKRKKYKRLSTDQDAYFNNNLINNSQILQDYKTYKIINSEDKISSIIRYGNKNNNEK